MIAVDIDYNYLGYLSILLWLPQYTIVATSVYYLSILLWLPQYIIMVTSVYVRKSHLSILTVPRVAMLSEGVTVCAYLDCFVPLWLVVVVVDK